MTDVNLVAKKIVKNSRNEINSSVLIKDENIVVVNCEKEFDFRDNNIGYKLLTKFDKYNLNAKSIKDDLKIILISKELKKIGF